jgi:hypothetical protein
LQDKISTYYEEGYRERINALYSLEDKKNIEKELEGLRNQITVTYAKGKMSDQHY